MNARSRCRILASQIDPYTMRCPSTMHHFHYHGTTGRYAPLTGIVPCPHRHRDAVTAERCTRSMQQKGATSCT